MISRLLKPEQITLDLKGKNKKEVLKELVELLPISEDKKKSVYEAILKREEIGSTGIGKGIAVPHCRSVLLDDVYLVVGISKKGVDFDSLDGKPVHFIFLLCATPMDPDSRYLITLGKIAHIARNLSKDKKYLEIDSKEKLIKYLKELEAKGG
jgi:mannitol/fructose-specific phosphotransferase system IIA component (Ntr-type)